MRERLAKIWTSLRGTWERLPKAARISVIVIGAALLGLSAYLVMNSDAGPMVPLYEQPLDLNEAAQVREYLQSRQISNRITPDGNLLVPEDQRLSLRMELASEGLQPVTAAGFELFDDQRFGASEFEQRVNFRRALEGELARTIRTIKGVDTVRVHLNLPRRSLFREEDTPPSASVVIALKRGAQLSSKRVVGIQELVARSVERLEPDRVAVLDDQGRMLSQDQEDAGGALALDYQRRYEHQLEQRVEEILERTIGQGQTVVRVSAEFDFSRMEETQESYDPERSVIRSEQTLRESEGAGAEQAGGIPGVRSNLPGGPEPQMEQSGETTSRTSETRNYEVDKVVRRVFTPVARVKRQSVAVLVDGRWLEPTEEGGERTFSARGEEEINQISSLVKRAVGFNEERGDEVDVQSMPFVAGDRGLGSDSELPLGSWPWWATWAVAGAAAFFVVAAMFLMLRRRKKGARSAGPQLPRTVKEIEASLEGGDTALAALAPSSGEAGELAALPGEVSLEDGVEKVRREALGLAAQDVEGAARVIRAWLAEELGEHEMREAS